MSGYVPASRRVDAYRVAARGGGQPVDAGAAAPHPAGSGQLAPLGGLEGIDPIWAIGTFTAYAWHRLAWTKGGVMSLSERLVYVAAAHHGDYARHSANGYSGSSASDLVGYTGYGHASLRRRLNELAAYGWLDYDAASRRWRMPAEADGFIHGSATSGSGGYVLCRTCLGAVAVNATRQQCRTCQKRPGP